MGNCCKKVEKKEDNKELARVNYWNLLMRISAIVILEQKTKNLFEWFGEVGENKPTKSEEVLYATIDHTNPSASNEENQRNTSTCEYAVINYHSTQGTTDLEQDTQEYEEVMPS